MTSTILEARAIVSAEAKGFDGVEKKIQGLSKSITSLGKLSTAMKANEFASSKMIAGLSNFDNRLASARMIERLSAIGTSAKTATAHVSRLGEAVQKMNAIQHLALGVALEHVAAKANEARKAIGQTYREFDKERRYGKAVMGISDAEQEPLIRQAIHGGATTKFNDIQFLEAQRELAARGLNIDQVRALTEVAAKIGMAMDRSLPESVKSLEGAMFGFHKSTATYEEAVKNAGRTADLLVKGSKISGMNYDDLVELYKFSATPFRFAGLSEEQLLAFGGVGKKSNMGGAEMGTAGRALVANLLNPTAGARTAMLAAGIDYSKYQTLGPKPMDANVFANDIASKYGVALDAGVRKSLQSVFNNGTITGNAAKFMPAITKILGDALGGDDAKSKKSIAGEARRYRDASVAGIDSQRLFNDLMVAIGKSPNLANAVFGAKQGARIRAAIGDPEVFLKKLDELMNHAEGYAKDVAEQRMAGFDGAVSRFEGAVKNLETAIGRSLDNDGKGGFLTGLADSAARATQAFAEMDPVVHQLAAALGAGGALYLGAKSFQNLMTGFGLSASATALDASAAELTAAAVALRGGTLSKGPGGAAAAAGGGWLAFLSRFIPAALIGATAASVPGAEVPGGIGSPEMKAQQEAELKKWRKDHNGRDPDRHVWHPIADFKHWLYGDPPPLPAGVTLPGEGGAPSPAWPKNWGGGSGPGFGPITAQVSGDATITIKIEAGSELIRAVAEAKSVKVPLNTGHSMPEAAPAGRGAQ